MIGRDPKICRNGHRYDGGCVREMRCPRCCSRYGCGKVKPCPEHDLEASHVRDQQPVEPLIKSENDL